MRRTARVTIQRPCIVTAAAIVCGFAALISTPVAGAATTSGAVISNGTVQLGVNDRGDLNYNCVGAGDTGCPDPSAGDGSSTVGVRYVPLNLDAISPGCPCEGWGLADAGSGLTGFANETAGDQNITVDSFNAPSATEAISTVTIADAAIPGFQMQIVQDYHPSPLSPNLFVDTVTVTNTGTNTLTDLRYRRAMDWDVEPTAFSEWVTIQGTSPQLLFNSDDGFASSDPLSGPSYIDSESQCGTGYTGPCQFTDLGSGGSYPTVTTPDDHGALFDFGLGQLAAGESRSFNIYYGAADSETAATAALGAGGAQVYSLGESNCTGDTIATCFDPTGNAGVEQGKPATFMFGFVTTIGDLSLTKSDSPDPVTVGQNLTYTIHVANNGPQAAAGVQVTDPLPANVDFVSATATQGSCTGTATVTCNLGSIALSGSADITIVVKPTSVGGGTLSNTATVLSASSDANPANDSDTEATQVLPADNPPIASAGADQTVTEGDQVTLDGSASSDPDGEALTYAWTAPAGVTLSDPSSASPTFTAPDVSADTPLTFTLQVCDEANPDSLCATDTVVITVQNVPAGDNPPIASAGADQTVTEGDQVTLDGSASSDPDGEALTYAWTAPAGVTLSDPSSASPTFTAPDVSADTPLTFTLQVCDEANPTSLCATDTVVVTVQNVAQPSNISINDVSMAEGNSGQTAFQFTVSLDAPQTAPVTVDFATADGTATAPERLHGELGDGDLRPRRDVTDGDRAGQRRHHRGAERDVQREPHERHGQRDDRRRPRAGDDRQ